MLMYMGLLYMKADFGSPCEEQEAEHSGSVPV